MQLQYKLAPTYSHHAEEGTKPGKRKERSMTLILRSEAPGYHSSPSKDLSPLGNSKQHEGGGLDEKRIKCLLCQESFSDYEDLLEHNQSAHILNNFYLCSFCGRSIKGKRQLRVHMNIHSGQKPYECPECHLAFYSSSAMNSHKNRHLKKFQCPICDKVLSNRSNLKDHKRTHTVERPFSCSICGKSFQQASNMRQHERTHAEPKEEETNEMAFRNNKRGKVSSCAKNLSSHKKAVPRGKEPLTGHASSKEDNLDGEISDQEAGDVIHQDPYHDSQDTQFSKGKERAAEISPIVATALLQKIKERERSRAEEKQIKEREGSRGEEKQKIECSLCEVGCFSGFVEDLLEHIKSSHHVNNSYQCSICAKLVKGTYQLKLHMRIHTGQKPYVCQLCGMAFYSSSALNSHKNRHSKIFQCSICQKAFQSSSHLSAHMRCHTGEKPYQCTVCLKMFPNISQLNVHKRIHSGDRPFQCSICKRSYASASDLRRHGKKHAQERTEKELPADNGDHSISETDICSQGSTKEYAGLKKDANLIHCSICEKGYTSRSGVANHIKVMHQVKAYGDGLYQCLVCNKVLQDCTDVTSHALTHAGEAPLRCSVCGKLFQQPMLLKQHEKRHSKQKPEPKICQCSICGKAFSRRSYLVPHMRIHTGEKPYQCPICGKSFTHKVILPYHMRLHTGERPHQCSTCGKAFLKKDALLRHSRRHTGEKPYICSVCGKGFAGYSGMKTHEQTHTGVKQHACSVCGKTYSSRQNLRIHSKSHTVS